MCYYIEDTFVFIGVAACPYMAPWSLVICNNEKGAGIYWIQTE